MALMGRMARTCTVIGIALAMSGVARADLITNFESAAWNGVDYTYQYLVTLSPGASINGAGGPVDLSTLVDFWYYVPGSATVLAPGVPADWAVSEQMVGINGIFQAPPDNPGLWNITFTYLGVPGIINPSPTDSLAVLRYTLRSSDPPAPFAATYYTATSTDLDPAGEPLGNTGLVIGPQSSVVPEPGLLSLLLGSGVGGSLLALRRRIRK